MAGTIQKRVVGEEFLILRSLYYKQALPVELLNSTSSVIYLMEKLASAGYVTYLDGRYELNDHGLRRLRRLNHGSKIPMIDIKTDMLLDNSEINDQYVVEGSLARQIVERVRGGM